jgi:hypothetical protein
MLHSAHTRVIKKTTVTIYQEADRTSCSLEQKQGALKDTRQSPCCLINRSEEDHPLGNSKNHVSFYYQEYEHSNKAEVVMPLQLHYAAYNTQATDTLLSWRRHDLWYIVVSLQAAPRDAAG